MLLISYRLAKCLVCLRPCSHWLKIFDIGWVGVAIRIAHLLAHQEERHWLYFTKLQGIDVPLPSIQLGIDYVVYQPFLFKELPIVQEVEAREYALEESAPFHFFICFLDGLAVVLA